MRADQLLLRLRDRLDEPTSNVYTDAELVRYLDEGVYDMFRLQVQHDESYNNCEFDITASTDSRALTSNIRVYDLPTWVHKITSVRVAGSSSDSRGENIPCRTLHNKVGSFWAFYGMSRIMVRGSKAGEDLTIECSKIPAPMQGGTVVGTSHSATSFSWSHSSATESKYENVFEADWYKNAIFEFTGADEDIAGQVAVGRSSSLGAGLITTVTFENAIGAVPTADDTWELHAEVPGSSSGYLLGLAAGKAFMRKSNYEALGSMQADIERERMRFIEAVTPRQDQVLNFAGMWGGPLYDRDLDRDESW